MQKRLQLSHVWIGPFRFYDLRDGWHRKATRVTIVGLIVLRDFSLHTSWHVERTGAAGTQELRSFQDIKVQYWDVLTRIRRAKSEARLSYLVSISSIV